MKERGDSEQTPSPGAAAAGCARAGPSRSVRAHLRPVTQPPPAAPPGVPAPTTLRGGRARGRAGTAGRAPALALPAGREGQGGSDSPAAPPAPGPRPRPRDPPRPPPVPGMRPNPAPRPKPRLPLHSHLPRRPPGWRGSPRSDPREAPGAGTEGHSPSAPRRRRRRARPLLLLARLLAPAAPR